MVAVHEVVHVAGLIWTVELEGTPLTENVSVPPGGPDAETVKLVVLPRNTGPRG